MPKKEKIVFRGKEYNSLEVLAKDYSMTTATLRGRLKLGYTLEQALDNAFNYKYSKVGTKLELEGTRYSSIAELAKDMYLETRVLNYRLSQGYTVEEAVDPDFSTKYDKRSRLKSSSLTHLSRTTGVSVSKIRYRLSKGFSLDEALDPDFSIKHDKRRKNLDAGDTSDIKVLAPIVLNSLKKK